MFLRILLSLAACQCALFLKTGAETAKQNDEPTKTESNLFWTDEKKKIMAEALGILADLELPHFCSILESTADARFYTRKDMIDYVLAAVVEQSNFTSHIIPDEVDSLEDTSHDIRQNSIDNIVVPNGNIGAMVEIADIPQSRSEFENAIPMSKSLKIEEDEVVLPYGGVSYGESKKGVANAVFEDETQDVNANISFKAFDSVSVPTSKVTLPDNGKVNTKKPGDVSTVSFEASVTDFAASGDGDSVNGEIEELFLSDPNGVSNTEVPSTSDATKISRVNTETSETKTTAKPNPNLLMSKSDLKQVKEFKNKSLSSLKILRQGLDRAHTTETVTVSTKTSTPSPTVIGTTIAESKLKSEKIVPTTTKASVRVTYDNSKQKQKSSRTTNTPSVPEIKPDVNAKIKESITEASKEILDVSDFGPTAVKGEIISGNFNRDGHVTSDGAIPSINSEIIKHPEGDLFQLDFFKSFFADMFTKPKNEDSQNNKINATTDPKSAKPTAAATTQKIGNLILRVNQKADNKGTKKVETTPKTGSTTEQKDFKATSGNKTSSKIHKTDNFSATFLPETKFSPSIKHKLVPSNKNATKTISAFANKNSNKNVKLHIPSSDLKMSQLATKASKKPVLNTALTSQGIRNDEPVSYWDLFRRQQVKLSTSKQPKTTETTHTRLYTRLQFKPIVNDNKDKPHKMRGIIPDSPDFKRNQKSVFTSSNSNIKITVLPKKPSTASPKRKTVHTPKQKYSTQTPLRTTTTTPRKTTVRQTKPTTTPIRKQASKLSVNSKRLHSRQEDEAHTEDFICPSVFGFYSDAADCKGFYICSWGFANRFSCPKGTAWNLRLNVCDWQSKVRCFARPMYEDYGYEEERR